MNDRQKEHEYCMRCGRKLKNQNARILGYGSVCYKKVQSESDISRQLFTQTVNGKGSS